METARVEDRQGSNQELPLLEDVERHFDDVTRSIGPNGVGKSTVLRALDWFFNCGKASELADDDRTHGIEGTVSVEL